MSEAIDFGRMSIPRLFSRLFLPTVLGMVFSSAFIIIDGMFVGRFIGSEALAAVNIVAPLWMLGTGCGLMFGVGASVVASIHVSQGRTPKARECMTEAIVVSSVMLAVFAALCWLWARPVVVLLGSSEQLAQSAVDYLSWFIPFTPTNALMISGAFFLRLDGAPRYSMICNVVASVANLVLDYLFIVVMGGGLRGAAIASSLGTVIGAAMILVYLFNRRHALHFCRFRIGFDCLRNVCRVATLGFSAFLCETAVAVMMFVGNIVFMRRLHEAGVAAFSVTCYFFPIIFMFNNAVSQSVQPIISYSYGSGNASRMRSAFRIGLAAAGCFGAAFTLLTVFGNELIASLFLLRTDPAFALSAGGLPLFAVDFIPFAVNIMSVGYFQSTEQPLQATIVTLLRGYILVVVLFFALPVLAGDAGIWLAVPIAEVLTTLYIVGVYFVRRRR